MSLIKTISITIFIITLVACQRKPVDYQEDKTPVNTGPTPEATAGSAR